MKLTFNQQTVDVKTHPEDSSLYCLNDLHRASGMTGKLNDLTRHLSEFKIRQYDVLLLRGNRKDKAQGTYANEQGVYWFASKISEEFEVAVFTSFKAAASGDSLQASLIANTVAIPQSLIDNTKAAEKLVQRLVVEETQNGNIFMYGHEVSNYLALACKAATGFVSSQVKASRRSGSVVDRMVSEGESKALAAYKAQLESMAMLVRCGVDYHGLGAVMQVKTSKNEDLFKGIV